MKNKIMKAIYQVEEFLYENKEMFTFEDV